MGYAIPQTLVMVDEICCSCSVPFAMPSNLQAQRRLDGGAFYCPNGHGQVYGKGEIGRLRDRLNEQTRVATQMAERAKLAEEAEQRAELAAAVAEQKVKRLTKRVAAGVCPCCHRTFKQLAAHMKNKHPTVTEE